MIMNRAFVYVHSCMLVHAVGKQLSKLLAGLSLTLQQCRSSPGRLYFHSEAMACFFSARPLTMAAATEPHLPF